MAKVRKSLSVLVSVAIKTRTFVVKSGIWRSCMLGSWQLFQSQSVGR